MPDLQIARVDRAVCPASRDGATGHRFPASRSTQAESQIATAAQQHAEKTAFQGISPELRCLYGISQLVETHGNSIGPILQGIAELLPASWQYPKACCARLVLDRVGYQSVNYRPTAWSQSAPVAIAGVVRGSVEVAYLEPKPPAEEGPFLATERDLLEIVAERTGKIVQRIEAERRLRQERQALEETNLALRRVLAEIEHDKKEQAASIKANVERVLMPLLRAVENELPGRYRHHVAMLREQLDELTSPFISKLSDEFAQLSPTELEICNLLRTGMSTKEIAQFRRVSYATVAKQRERIRRKLGLIGTDQNLPTFLRLRTGQERR